MYISYYGLKSKPFQISSDPGFIWLGEKHKEALATLTYGVLDNKGFMLLTGDVGTGKTTLINTLISNLSDDVLHAFVPDPRLDLSDFLNYVARAFGIRREFKSKGKFLLYFSDFLEKAYAEGKKVLLLIDEAQLLTQELLEEIRLLSNIQKDGNNLLNIFFIGQDEFNEVLERSENRAVAQRLTLNYHLNPLSEAEVGMYIRHRLKVAGTTARLFDNRAIREIHGYSGGFPRRINIICDHCLLNGYVKEKELIDAEMVRICAHDLKIPQYRRKVAAPPPRPIPPSSDDRPGKRSVSSGTGEGRAATSTVGAKATPQYASGNDDVRIGLRQEQAHPVLTGMMTTLIVLSGGLLIFYVLAPGTFVAGYRSLLDRLAPVQHSVSRLVTEQTERLKSGKKTPEQGREKESEQERPGDRPQGTDDTQGRNTYVPALYETVQESVQVAPSGQRTFDFSQEMKNPQHGQGGHESDGPLQQNAQKESVSAAELEKIQLPTNQELLENGGDDRGDAVRPSGHGDLETGPVDAMPGEVLEVAAEEGGSADIQKNGQMQIEQERAVEVPTAQIPSERSGLEPIDDTGDDRLRMTRVPADMVVTGYGADNSTVASDDVFQGVEMAEPTEELSSEVIQGILVVRFSNNSSDFVFEDLAGLEDLVAHLKSSPQVVIRISGHTDGSGAENYNYRLSLFRANMLKSYFLGKGINPSQMIVKGYGSTVPIASNSTAEGRRRNRRVEIQVVE